jgi:antitoxin (DNA-binding transcriptional repressor) of toxin-antitoxin stability system
VPPEEVLAQHGRNIVDLVSVAEMEAQTPRQGESGTGRVHANRSCRRQVPGRESAHDVRERLEADVPLYLI